MTSNCHPFPGGVHRVESVCDIVSFLLMSRTVLVAETEGCYLVNSKILVALLTTILKIMTK